MTGKLVFKDGTELSGASFGFPVSSAGEIVFSTGMVGYPESLTDPSFAGQIVVFTYPIIGNYGVPDISKLESNTIHVSGLVVSTYNPTPSHWDSKQTLSEWLNDAKIPALEIKDTRFLAQKIREQGVMSGKIVIKKDIPFVDSEKINLVNKVSTKKVMTIGSGSKKIVVIDCGVKETIIRCLLKRDTTIHIVPWDFDLFHSNLKFDAIVISNGPGDPKMVDITIETITKALKKNIPIFGICLGNQILALASGGDTYKLKFGHRSQNQPCLLEGSKRCYLTTQNHGFAVGTIPKGFQPWFTNANDGTNEGIIHKTKPFMSVQFHPEASAGPTDTEWLFDYFLKRVK
ncbi:MAG: glutamine-hydrolyzing carbamoyl-phosphate synthase small subunit [Candidatus Roizmanbacteria bacterium]